MNTVGKGIPIQSDDNLDFLSLSLLALRCLAWQELVQMLAS